MSDDVGGLERVAANERHFLDFAKSHRADSPIVLECECTSALCDERIELTADQYQPLRSSAAQYAVCPHAAHVDAKSDRVIDRYPHYWVVERRPSLELLDFYSSRTRTTTLDLNTGVAADEPDTTA